MIVMLLVLPLSSLADNTDDRDVVVFKLYLNHKHWGIITVLCDSTKYYINLPELLAQLEYKHSVDYQKKVFIGHLSELDSTSFVICGDSLNYSLWSSSSEEFFVESTEIEKRYGFKFFFTLGSLALDMITEKGVPIVLRRLREDKIARITQQKATRQLVDIDTLRPRVFNVNSIGYALNASIGTDNDMSFNGNVTGEAFHGTYLLNYEIADDNLPWSSNVRLDWKKPFLDKKGLKTVRVFHDMNTMDISTEGYLTGVMFSNENYSTGAIRNHLFQGRTTPDTDVEIYNNGQLIQYVKSDSLGNYQVEIAYYEGENNIKAVSYDSFGVPSLNESMVYMPPGLQRKKKFSYIASVGVSDYGEPFFDISGEYGLFNNLTLGVTNQTLFIPGDIKSITRLTSKYTIMNRMRIDLNYIPAVKYSAMLTGNIGSLLTGNITYESYNKTQNVIYTSINKNLIASVNGSIPMKNVNGNYYLRVQYYKMGITNNYSTNMSLNLWWKKFSGTLSFSTVSQKMKLENAVYEARLGYRFNNKMYDELAVSYRGRSKSFDIRNRFNYQFSNKLNAYCEVNSNTMSRNYNVSLGVSWRLPWLQLRGGVRQSNAATTTYANVSGSMLLYEHMNVAFTDKFVSGASLLIVPFLDENGNGVKDKNESVMKETKIMTHIRTDIQKTKSGISFSNIVPNQAFKIVIPRQAYEDITWQIDPQDICLVLAPHQSRTINIPVKILTELSGQITVTKPGQVSVVNGVPVTVTNMHTGKTIELHSDEWGYYSTMVVCGNYSISVDTDSLDKSGLECAVPIRHVVIEPSRDGQQLLDLNFVCHVKK